MYTECQGGEGGRGGEGICCHVQILLLYPAVIKNHLLFHVCVHTLLFSMHHITFVLQ